MSRWLLILVLAAPPALAAPRRIGPPPPPPARDETEASLARSIDMLEDLVSQTDGQRRAPLIHRLAELYFRRARLARLAAMDDLLAAQTECDAVPDCEDSTLRPDLSGYEAWHDRALRASQLVVRTYPRYDRAGEAHFALALGLLERERADEAAAALTTLVRTHPDHALAHLAWLQLGEIHFDQGRAFPALKAFRQAASFREGEQRPLALHRLAWALWNVGEPGDAIDTLKQVVAIADRGATDAALGEEARQDLVRFVVEEGDARELEAYLGQGDRRRQTLAAVAARFAAQGDVDAAVLAWRRAVAEAPDHAERPAAVASIAEQLRGAARWREALDAARQLERDHRPTGTWARANAARPDLVLKARDAADVELRRLAVAAHTQARKLRSRTERSAVTAVADQAYRTWLEAFASEPSAADVHWAYGELLYEAEHYDDAWAQYQAVWTAAPDGARARKAAENAIFAAERLMERARPPRPDPGADLATVAPRPFTTGEQRYIEAAEAYIRLAGPESRAVKQRIAAMHYEAFHFDQAAVLFRRMIASDPGSIEAEQSAHLIADMLSIRQEWASLAENTRFFAEQTGLGDAPFRAEMWGLHRQARLKVIEADLARTGDRAGAADAYVAWAAAFDDTAATDTLGLAHRNAAAHYAAAGDRQLARDARVRFVDDPRFADAPTRTAQLAELGADEESLARFEPAADRYAEAVSRWTPDDGDPLRDVIVDAAWRAAVLLRALDRRDAARAAYARFAALAPDDPRLLEARVALAELADADERPARWAALARDPDLPVAYRSYAVLQWGRTHEATGDAPAALAAWTEGLGTLPGTAPPDAVDAIAEVRLNLAAPDFDAFAARRIAARPDLSPRAEDRHFAGGVRSMQQQAEALDRRYSAVIDTGSGTFGLAALVQLGRVQEAWADALLASDAPSHLTHDQRIAYEQRMRDVVFSRREAARGIYAHALQRAFALTLYTDATALARERLAALDPEGWPALHETRVQPRFLAGARPAVGPELE